MNNFDLYILICILFGKGVIEKLCEQILVEVCVLIIYGGGSVKKIGVLDQVFIVLNGLDVFEFGGIELNLFYEILMNVVKFVWEEKVIFLLVVGGGLVLDGIKFIVVVVYYDVDIDLWEILEIYGSKIVSVILMGLVLILLVIGFEFNKGVVILWKIIGDKCVFMFLYVQLQFVIFDLVYIYILLLCQVVNGVVDVFVYIFEQYVIYLVDGKIQDCFVEGIFLILIEDGLKVLQELENYNVCVNIMWVVMQVLNGLIGVGVLQDWVMYMFGYELMVMYGLDYVQMLVIVLLVLWNEKCDVKCEKLLQYVECVWNIIEGFDD